MFRKTLLIVALCLTPTSAALADDFDYSIPFRWPDAQERPLEDARLTTVINQALSVEHEAATREQQAKRAQGQSVRRMGLLSTVGRTPRPIVIDAGTIMISVPVNTESGEQIGHTEYPDGARMTGVFGQYPSVGYFEPAPESAFTKFFGEVHFSGSSRPQPYLGRFWFQNGDNFRGKVDGADAIGVYCSKDCERKFIGRVDLSGSEWTPIAGYEVSKRNKLTAVVW